MGGVCSTYGSEEGCRQGNLREKIHLEDPAVDGRIILRWIFRKWMSRHGLDRAGCG